jgi:hypothetical protein
VVQRPSDIGAFQFVVLTSLRAAQLMRGCRPRVDGAHKPIMMAQVEVAEGKVVQASAPVKTGWPDRDESDPTISTQPGDGVTVSQGASPETA